MWICERCVKCTGCTPQLIIGLHWQFRFVKSGIPEKSGKMASLYTCNSITCGVAGVDDDDGTGHTLGVPGLDGPLQFGDVQTPVVVLIQVIGHLVRKSSQFVKYRWWLNHNQNFSNFVFHSVFRFVLLVNGTPCISKWDFSRNHTGSYSQSKTDWH